MVLELSKSFNHETCKKKVQEFSESEKKDLILKLMQECGVDTSQARINGGTLEMNATPNIKLHSLMLRAEELGLDICYTRKTLIEIR